MSLLTSPYTTREQQRFFSKMEREFNKRSFHNTNFSEPTNLLQKVNDNTEKSQEQIKEAMHSFLLQLKDIIADSHNTRIDYYFILSEMKNTDFFSEVAALIAQDLVQRGNKLEKENFKLREEIKRSLQRIRELERSEPKEEKSSEIHRFNGIRSISENLYEKAKLMSEQEFIELCNKAILGDKVIIKKVSDLETYRKWDENKLDKIEEKDMMRRIDSFIESKGKTGEANELADLITELRARVNEGGKAAPCPSPCCHPVTDNYITKTSKASLVRRSTDSRRKEEVYKNDRSQEYFNRYYRRSEFDMHKVTNVQKTKLEEMEKIEDDYRINLKQRKKNFSLLSR